MAESRFALFMLGAALVVAQSALVGMLAYWLASRQSRVVRILGGIFVVADAWMSIVGILNKLTHDVGSDLDVNIVGLVTLILGWVAGRNHRLRSRTSAAPLIVDVDAAGAGVATAVAASPKAARLLFPNAVKAAGTAMFAIAYLYALGAGLLAFGISVNIVSDAAGFWGFVVAFVVAPVTFAVAPLYAGVRLHNWTPALFTYGGMFAAYLGVIYAGLVQDAD